MRMRGIVSFILMLACSGPPPPSPAAVINATPSSVCIGDDFQTPIHLDSRGSSPTLSLVYTTPDPDAGTLDFLWSFSGVVCLEGLDDQPTDCDVKIDPSSFDSTEAINGDSVLLTVAGQRPVDVTLTVTNESTHASSTAQTTIAITLLEGGVCPLPIGP